MNNNTKIIIVLLIIAVSSISCLLVSGFGLVFEGKESDFYATPVTGENISAYKNSCAELKLTDLSKNYNALNGKNVKVTGQIYQKEEYIQFDKTRSNIILKVAGLSEPYMIISYTGTLPYNTNDTVTVYGEYMFPTSINSLPELSNQDLVGMKAGYIEKT